MNSTGDVFAAVGDPTRRAIFERLTTSGPFTATGLASELDISRQAVAKHLGILSDAGLATSARVGRETRFAADASGLEELGDWVARVEGEWSRRLDALARSLEET